MAPSILLSLLILLLPFTSSQPALNPSESNSVYSVLESVNPTLPWRTLFPDDPCSAPHGVVCDYFQNDTVIHVTELSLGFVSDYSPNPVCNPNSTLNPDLLSPLTHLRKLFFYKCFTKNNASLIFPNLSLLASLEEIVFIENPGLTGSLKGSLGSLTNLRRLVLTGTGVSGEIPDEIGGLESMEELSLSRNKLTGEIPSGLFNKLKNLKLLDLGYNRFKGDLPGSVGDLSEVLKIDLSYNEFSGKIPENLKNLKRIEFLDLGYNQFGNFGVPLFLSEMKSLKEVYLSGNLLGGTIPEIWENLGGILAIGLSNTGLIGNIPKSMGVFLVNAVYIGLGNNSLVGGVPNEFGSMGSVLELNLENNLLTGQVPFSTRFVAKLGEKLKLRGNSELCVDKGLLSDSLRGSLGNLKVCNESSIFTSSVVLAVGGSFVMEFSRLLMLLGFLVICLFRW